ncbi:MAG: VOC family protein [Acidobacteriota bacterium]
MTSPLGTLVRAVIGCSDLPRTGEIFAGLGFDEVARGELDASSAQALYDLETPLRERDFAVPGSAGGGIRLVATPRPPRAAGAFDHRPLALDLYTRDIERSLSLAKSLGATPGTIVDYDLGELMVREAESRWRDGLRLVFLQANRRRPSALDASPDRQHSEVHSVVFTLPSVDRALATWHDLAGLQVLNDARIEGPILSTMLDLPRPQVPVRFALLGNRAASPARLELIEFPEDTGSWPAGEGLAAGLHAATFEVENLETAMAALSTCQLRTPTRVASGIQPGARRVAGWDPAGVRFELWESFVEEA